MLVHPVVVPGSGTRSWTVLGDDDVPVVPVDRFLAYLTDIGRSPNTVKAYAHDLKDYWCFIGFRGLDWREARLEDIGEFVAWLQFPRRPVRRGRGAAVRDGGGDGLDGEPQARGSKRVLCPPGPQRCRGRRPAGRVADRRARRMEAVPAPYQQRGPYRGRAITLKAPRKLPRILTVAEEQAILDACTRLRDRFFFALLHESGCRAGEALGLRHEDIAAAESGISVVPRDNANGARAKSGGRTVPVGPELIRLYADYQHEGYGTALAVTTCSSTSGRSRRGQAWSYQAAYDLVLRLRARTGIAFDPHWHRHSAAATRWLRDGVSDRGRVHAPRPLIGDHHVRRSTGI